MPVSAYFRLKVLCLYNWEKASNIFKTKKGGNGKNRSECPVISILCINEELMTLGAMWKGPGGSRISVFQMLVAEARSQLEDATPRR